MADETPYITWQQMLESVRSFVDTEANLRKVHQTQIMCQMGLYKSNEDDFKEFMSFDQSGYSKNLVEGSPSDTYNVIVMCWKPGQESAFHAHEGSKCFVKILSGELTEMLVDYPTIDSKVITKNCQGATLKRDQVSYIDDTIGVHKMINKSEVEPAVSLHIYKPAYTRCRIFAMENGSQSITVKGSEQIEVTFNNKQGKSQPTAGPR